MLKNNGLLSLILMLLFGIALYLILPQSKILKISSSLIIVFAFINWGWHHQSKKSRFNPHIIWEYLILGFVALALMFFLIYHD